MAEKRATNLPKDPRNKAMFEKRQELLFEEQDRLTIRQPDQDEIDLMNWAIDNRL